MGAYNCVPMSLETSKHHHFPANNLNSLSLIHELENKADAENTMINEPSSTEHRGLSPLGLPSQNSRTGCLTNKRIYFSSSGGWEGQDQGAAESASDEATWSEAELLTLS